MVDLVFADISTYQPFYSSSYAVPRDVIEVRADSGYGTDTKIVDATVSGKVVPGNWSRIKADLDAKKLACAIIYVVYIPGANTDILTRLKRVFGMKPDPRLAWMIDMESGSGFAGSGDHSTGANQLAELLAAWCGSKQKVIGYANGGDWARCWPHPPTWMPVSKRIIAQYGGTKPSGYFAWQYTNGTYTNQYGLPSQSPPFGACDHNLYLGPGGLDGMLRQLGIIASSPSGGETEVTTQLWLKGSIKNPTPIAETLKWYPLRWDSWQPKGASGGYSAVLPVGTAYFNLTVDMHLDNLPPGMSLYVRVQTLDRKGNQLGLFRHAELPSPGGAADLSYSRVGSVSPQTPTNLRILVGASQPCVVETDDLRVLCFKG